MIEFINVNKEYVNGVVGLHNVNIKIENGEFIYIIGPSGAGKSTFLKLINRQEKASSGSIVVNNKNLTKMRFTKVPYLRREIGVVFQDFKLLDKLTVYQNVAFVLEVIGVASGDVRKKTVQALTHVGLHNKMSAYPNQLSGGEQQRVAIARAIVNDPQIIIADEPTGNLDSETSEQIMIILKKLNNEGKTIIMATHEHRLISENNCRVLTINHGTIINDEVKGCYANS